MINDTKKLGNFGEELALDFLENLGYKLIKKNLRLFCGEIDLLMEDGDTLVICEVKTMAQNEYGVPQEKVDFFKRKKLLQLAKALWQLYPGHSIRIDVVAIDQNNKIEHLINAVEEG